MWLCDRIRAIIVQRRLDDGDQDAVCRLWYKIGMSLAASNWVNSTGILLLFIASPSRPTANVWCRSVMTAWFACGVSPAASNYSSSPVVVVEDGQNTSPFLPMENTWLLRLLAIRCAYGICFATINSTSPVPRDCRHKACKRCKKWALLSTNKMTTTTKKRSNGGCGKRLRAAVAHRCYTCVRCSCFCPCGVLWMFCMCYRLQACL